MATGQKFEPDKEDVIEVLERCNGMVTEAARKFKVTHQTLLRYCRKHPDIMTALEEARDDYDDQKLDVADDVFMYAMKNKEENLNQALRAAFGVMINLGHLRNWKKPNSAEDLYIGNINPFWAYVEGQNKILQQQSSKVTSLHDRESIAEAD